MNRSTRLAVWVLTALAALSVSPSFAFFSDSGSFARSFTAAGDFADTDPDTDEKVWVCKIVGPPGGYFLKPGKNPIHVSVNSVDAEEGFSDAHPSYIVEPGETCTWPREEPGAEPRAAGDGTDEETIADTTTTTAPTATTVPTERESDGTSPTTLPDDGETTTTTTTTVASDPAPDPAATITTTVAPTTTSTVADPEPPTAPTEESPPDTTP